MEEETLWGMPLELAVGLIGFGGAILGAVLGGYGFDLDKDATAVEKFLRGVVIRRANPVSPPLASTLETALAQIPPSSGDFLGLIDQRAAVPHPGTAWFSEPTSSNPEE